MTDPSLRPSDQLRPITIESFDTNAAGSVLISCGSTRVLCTASVESKPPKWLPRDEDGNYASGWVTAEYSMLPGSTLDRKRRGPDGRGTEIQRLIGRSLRAAVDMKAMPGVMVTVDCDVLKADGGTRTASITGGYVALARALADLQQKGELAKSPILGPVTAVSVGVIEGKAYLDLDYDLDHRAEVDLNVVMNAENHYIEVQGTGEQGTFSRDQLNQLLDLAQRGVTDLRKIQIDAVGD